MTGNGGRAKLWLTPLGVAYLAAYNRTQRAAILTIAADHEAFFLEKWNEFRDDVDLRG